MQQNMSSKQRNVVLALKGTVRKYIVSSSSKKTMIATAVTPRDCTYTSLPLWTAALPPCFPSILSASRRHRTTHAQEGMPSTFTMIARQVDPQMDIMGKEMHQQSLRSVPIIDETLDAKEQLGAGTDSFRIMKSPHTREADFAKTTASSQTLNPPHIEPGVSVITDDTTSLVDMLLETTYGMLESDNGGCNVVAYSGGVDSSLVAALVHRSFHTGSYMGGGKTETLTGGAVSSGKNVKAVLGLSPAVPTEQVELARNVASIIGIELTEIRTKEGTDETYLANEGHSCLACKTHLYTALCAAAEHAMTSLDSSTGKVVLFNGTNADDLHDTTRVGLIAASNFSVMSPLSSTTKADVRRAARHIGLPNWNYAASPCLRSRLALGVRATQRHLQMVGEAERRIRSVMKLDPVQNVRVRLLSGNRAGVELDSALLDDSEEGNLTRSLIHEAVCDFLKNDCGLDGYIVRPFKSGSVAALPRSSTVKVAPTDCVVI